MRPNFALNILADGLDLLHRASPGWERVGHVSFDDPDMAASLARLRRLGQALDPAPMRTKLILPNDQIRYLSVYTGATTEADRRALVMSELDGATPYALEDLGICWSVSGTTTHVAAVARETLEEAEAFATEHQLNPVSYVAIPGEAPYLGEPFFGPTGLADTLLAGERVERDAVQVHVLGNASLPSLPDEPAASEPAAAKPRAEETPERPEPPKAEAPAAPEAEAAPQTAATPKAPEPPAPPPVAPPEPAEPAEAAQEGAPTDSAPAAETPPQVTFRARRDLFDLDTPAEPAAPAARRTPAKPADTPAARDETPRDVGKGFASVRSAPPAPQSGPAAPKAPQKGATPATDGAPSDTPAPAAPAAAKGAAAPPARKAPAAPAKSTAPKSAKPAKGRSAAPKAPVVEAPAKPPSPDAAAASLTAPVPQPGDGTPAAPRKAPAQGDLRAREAEKMTVFGARPSQQDLPAAPRRGMRRLALGSVALVALLVAGWVLLGIEPDPAPEAPEQAEAQPAPAEAAAVTQPEAIALLPPEEAPEQAAATPPPPEVAEPAAPEETAAETPALPLTPMEIRPAPATPAEAAARYAATGIWQRAPQPPVSPVATPLGEIALAALTPTDRVAPVTGLPDTSAARPPVTFTSPPNPPLADQRFTLDARGLVAGTAEGARTPEGHMVYAGRPPVVPPARPAETLQPGAEGAEGAEAQPVALPLATPPADSAETPAPEAEAQTEPQAEATPTEEAPEADVAEATEATATAPEDQLRPRLRPEGLAPEAEAEATPETDAEAEAAAEPEADIDTEAIESATDLAASLALRPRPRPEDFEALVAAAQAAALAAPVITVPTPSVTPAAPVQPSVARQATVENAINLNNVNLIGVSGSPSERTALVRLSDGRIRKVQVGDRLDGGRVAAIGEGELRYVKGNRNLLLEMPD